MHEQVVKLLSTSNSEYIINLDPEEVVEKLPLIWARRTPEDNKIALKIEKYRSSVIGYDFIFDITEGNGYTGAANFRLPFTNGIFNWGLAGGLTKERKAKREFKTEETFADLAKLPCDGYTGPASRNHIYPLAGSVGMTEVINTFFSLGALGGGKKNFSDTLIFTTDVGFGADGTTGADVSINQVPNRHRLLNANLSAAGARNDVHQVTITISFPLIDDRTIVSSRGLGPAKAAEVQRRTLEFVEIERCIQRAEAREDRAGQLRDFAPELFCSQQANNFRKLGR
ncbi:MAG: hypothetical protein ACR2O4_09515 [Hyphomicrobiaceae bacterium]